MDCTGALTAAGSLADSYYGRSKYVDYLEWLANDIQAQNEMAFKKMCYGWALGTKDFRKRLVSEAAETEKLQNENESEPDSKIPYYDGKTLREANELRWELMLEKCMAALEKTTEMAGSDIKSADWKILIAAVLKSKTSAPNGWIARKLNMGVPHAVSRYVGIFRQNGKDKETEFLKLFGLICSNANITE